MANNRLEFEGLAELREQLRKLPRELASEASSIVNDAADSAARDVQNGYPSRTGKLRRGITVRKVSAGPFTSGVEVRNTNPLAFIFESGTQARHTSIGANRGSMPPGHVFIPAMRRHRRRMYDRLKALVKSKGLEVTGDE